MSNKTQVADMSLVYNKWLDSKQPSGNWRFLSSGQEWSATIVNSVGFLIHEDESIRVIAQNLSDEESDGDRQYSGDIVIPKQSVLFMRVLLAPKQGDSK
jgi:hypothetical protein